MDNEENGLAVRGSRDVEISRKEDCTVPRPYCYAGVNIYPKATEQGSLEAVRSNRCYIFPPRPNLGTYSAGKKVSGRRAENASHSRNTTYCNLDYGLKTHPIGPYFA